MQKRGFNDYIGVIGTLIGWASARHRISLGGKKNCFYYLYFVRRHVKNLKMGIALGKG